MRREELIPHLKNELSEIENQIHELEYRKNQILRLLEELRSERADGYHSPLS